MFVIRSCLNTISIKFYNAVSWFIRVESDSYVKKKIIIYIIHHINCLINFYKISNNI